MVELSDEWLLKMAKREGDCEIGAGAMARDPIIDDGMTYCKTCDEQTFRIQCGNCSGNIECDQCMAYSRENDWICERCLENGVEDSK